MTFKSEWINEISISASSESEKINADFVILVNYYTHVILVGCIVCKRWVTFKIRIAGNLGVGWELDQ